MVPHGLDVVGFGLNTIDLSAVVGQYPEPDSGQWLTEVAERSGDQAATTVIACARLGCHAPSIGRFGDDVRGRLARANLEQEGEKVRRRIGTGDASVWQVATSENACVPDVPGLALGIL